MPTPLSEATENLAGTVGNDVVDVVERAAGALVAVVDEAAVRPVETVDTGRVGSDPEIADRIFVDAVHLVYLTARRAVSGRW